MNNSTILISFREDNKVRRFDQVSDIRSNGHELYFEYIQTIGEVEKHTYLIISLKNCFVTVV